MAARGGVDSKLYETLGVPRGAAESEIKRAYHKLAKEFHPDKNPEAGDRFKEISFAYDVLSDQKKRDIYDRYGLKGLQEGAGGREDFFGGFGGHDIFSEFFGGSGMFFGGGGGGGGGGHSRTRKGEDTLKALKVTLDDLYNGKSITIKHSRNAVCGECLGSGTQSGKSAKPCQDCRGGGVKMQYRQLGPGLVQQIQTVCHKCSGQGNVIAEKDKCKTCEGKKVAQEVKDIEVHVDKGMTHGMKITMAGEGDEEPGVQPGDLIFVIQQESHSLFERQSDNLIMKHTLTLSESLCGFQFVIRHLDGREMVITRAPGHVVPSESIQIVEGEGMPHYKRPFDKGHLLIKFKVQFPENNFTDEKALKMLETLLPPRPGFEMPTGDNVEEVDLNDHHPTEYSATQESDDDDEPHGARVGCAQQ